MKHEINLINNVIGTHFGNETDEIKREYSKHVVNAWNKILNHLSVERHNEEQMNNE
tara:strand:- start:503 stop:670 length:168 start_codon:yes stop_codon:yes gene_type:complete